jgi:hypothetical protein
MAEAKTYTGGCHCGAVRYRVTLALERAMSCNCSICSKTGTLLAFAPRDQFQLTSGDDALQDYQWGKKRIHHLFCRRCGIRSFARGSDPSGREMVAVNLRTLDDVDLAAVPVGSFDGKSLPIEA